MATFSKITNKGQDTWRAWVRISGHPPLNKVFKSKTLAKQWAREREAEIRRGDVIKSYPGQKKKFSEAADKYINDVLPRKSASTAESQKHRVQWWSSKLGAHKMSNITPGSARCSKRKGNVRAGSGGAVSAIKFSWNQAISICCKWYSR